MRTVLLAAFMAFITVYASAHSNPSETDDNNLYSLALKASILQMEKEWGHLGRSLAGLLLGRVNERNRDNEMVRRLVSQRE